MKASVRISRGVESLFGTRDENIQLIESLGVHTQLVDNSLEIEGDASNVSVTLISPTGNYYTSTTPTTSQSPAGVAGPIPWTIEDSMWRLQVKVIDKW